MGNANSTVRFAIVTRGRRRGLSAAGLALILALAGCASVPDAVRGTSPTPQQDLVRVLNAQKAK